MILSRCYPPLPLLEALEEYFGCEVTAASFFELQASSLHVPFSWAKGDHIVLPRGLLSPLREEGVFLLAHEVCHLRQQAEHSCLTPVEAECEANYHALCFCLRYLTGQLRQSDSEPLQLAQAATTPAMCWGLGGLFSLKQLITDGYAKHQGYAYFYQGPHEWLTQTAARSDLPKTPNYTTRIDSIDEDSLILGSEMNDMYILPLVLKDMLGEEKLRDIGIAAEQSDFNYLSNLKLFDGIDVALIDKKDPAVSMRVNSVLWLGLLSGFLQTSRFIELLTEKKKEINEKISDELGKDILDDAVTELKHMIIDTIIQIIPADCYNSLFRISLFSLFTDFDDGDGKMPGFFESVVQSLLYDGTVDEESQRKLGEVMSSIKRTLNSKESDLVKAITLAEIWWKSESDYFLTIEAKIVQCARDSVSLKNELKKKVKDGTNILRDYIKKRLDYLNFEGLPGEVTIYCPWVSCNLTELHCEVTDKPVTINLESLKSLGKSVKELFLEPIFTKFFSSLDNLIDDYVVPLLQSLVEELCRLSELYTTAVFLLGSHTGELQFLHSMDCSNGSTQWNREKMLRWCRFCFDCCKACPGESILDQNIFSYLDKLVPSTINVCQADSEVSSNESSEELTGLAGTVGANLDRFRKYYSLPEQADKRKQELLLATMLLPLCCIRLQMNNCQFAAKRVIKLPENTAATQEQAMDYDICLLIALKESLHEESEGEGLRESYRTPIADMTFRQFFTASRQNLTAEDILLGMTMHMIEDSFTPSHTVRTWNTTPGTGVAPVITFADYTKQDASRHACADYFSDAQVTMSVDEKSLSRDTQENLRDNLPLAAATNTVGVECALHFAEQFYRHVKYAKGNVCSYYDSNIAESIYPLIGESLKKEGNGHTVRIDNIKLDLSSLDTPPSGRCYEMEALKEETFFSRYRDTIIRATFDDMIQEKKDIRIEKLRKYIDEYRKYLFKYFAPNRYPAQGDLSYYQSYQSKTQKSPSEVLKSLTSLLSSGNIPKDIKAILKEPVWKRSLDSSKNHTELVLRMYLQNDIPFLSDILTAPLLRKSVKMEYESENGNDTAAAIAEDIQLTFDRYIRHLNEVILNAVGIYEKTAKNDPAQALAVEVIRNALLLKIAANSLWEDGPVTLTANKLAQFMKEKIADSKERAILFIRTLLEGFDTETINVLLLEYLNRKNPQEFQQNAGVLLEELEKLLEGGNGGDVFLDAVQQLRRQYQFLTASVDPEIVRREAESFCHELAEIIRKINLKDFPSIRRIKLSKEIGNIIYFLQREIQELTDSAISLPQTVSGVGTSDNSAALFESYLSATLLQVKKGVSFSSWGSEMFGEDYQAESILKIGQSLQQALIK
ncbi:MAG: hypothetical protein HUJ66_05970 [Oscillospiraceae bacterium]|nr:hypothetical protein [Oscillospiraceae bacterium]